MAAAAPAAAAAAPAAAAAVASLAGDGDPTGPPQKGRGVQGQSVYWITMAHPKPETVANLGLKVPTDFDRTGFSKLMVKARGEEGIDIIGRVCKRFVS